MKINHLVSFLGLAIASLLFSGCVGTPFRWETARKVHVGMTKAEVLEVMGKPYVMSTAGETDIWQWTYGTGLGTGGNYRIVIKDGKVSEVPRIPEEL